MKRSLAPEPIFPNEILHQIGRALGYINSEIPFPYIDYDPFLLQTFRIEHQTAFRAYIRLASTSKDLYSRLRRDKVEYTLAAMRMGWSSFWGRTKKPVTPPTNVSVLVDYLEIFHSTLIRFSTPLLHGPINWRLSAQKNHWKCRHCTGMRPPPLIKTIPDIDYKCWTTFIKYWGADGRTPLIAVAEQTPCKFKPPYFA